MIQILFLSFFCTCVFGANTKGVLNLDSWTFDKVVDGSKTVLVMFDKEYPYGDHIDEFKKFAATIGEMGSQSKGIIIAQVGKTDYGDIKNIDLHERFNVQEDDFPVFKIFKKGSTEPIDWYAEKSEINVDSLSVFVQSEGGIWVGLAGCIKEFDKAAKIFMQEKNKRETILAEKTQYLERVDESEKDSVKAYVRAMKKIIEKGEEFIETEIARINKLKGGNLSDKKKDFFQRRLNVLSAFKVTKEEKGKEEL